MIDKILGFLEVTQVILPLYCLYRLFLDQYKPYVIFSYLIGFMLFFILKLGIYIPTFGSGEDRFMWAIPNIIFFSITIYLIQDNKRQNELHGNNNKIL